MYINGKWSVLNMRLKHFKDGDKVYCPMLSHKIFKVVQYDEELFWVDDHGLSVRFNSLGQLLKTAHSGPVIFHVNANNLEYLKKLYPEMIFEE